MRFLEPNPNIRPVRESPASRDEKNRPGTTPKETIPALMSVTDLEIAQIRADVFAASSRRDSYHHGERHWLAVAHAGLHLALSVDGCDPLIVLLFALFHDAMRENEYDDPEHGLRGGRLARRLLQNKLAAERLETLNQACRDHTHSRQSDDPTIAVCWDADRLNLWRIGTEPDPTFLSTDAARNPALIRQAQGFHESDYDWEHLTRLALDLAPE